MSTPITFSPDMALLRETKSELLRRLRTVRQKEDVFAALCWAAKEMNRTFGRTDLEIKAKVACRSGCSFCCQVPMGVQAHEVFLAADYIQKKFSAGEITALINRADAHKQRVVGLSLVEYEKLKLPCALLRDGACSIYEPRPEVCRAHHASDARLCEAALMNSSIVPHADMIPLRSRMFGVMLGIDQAMTDEGFDGRAYDFGSALYEALSDDQRVQFWMEKKQAFPDLCREPPMIEGAPPGEFRRGALG